MEPTNLIDVLGELLEQSAAILANPDSTGLLEFPELTSLEGYAVALETATREIATAVNLRAAGIISDDATTVAVANVVILSTVLGMRLGALESLGHIVTPDDISALLSGEDE